MRLDTVTIASPCDADWSAMTGSEANKHCAMCDKSVHNLSEMSRPDAETLLANGSDLCVRIQRNSDGSIATRSSEPLAAKPPVRSRRPRWSRRIAKVAISATLLVGAQAMAGDSTPEQDAGESSWVANLVQKVTDVFYSQPTKSPEANPPVNDPHQPPEMGEIVAPRMGKVVETYEMGDIAIEPDELDGISQLGNSTQESPAETPQ